jgi:hypothetical protein
MIKTRASQATKKKAKKVPVTPEVLSPQASSPPAAFTMDGTSHVEISEMQNIYYSKEIIEETRNAFSIDRLKTKIADDKTEFLAEGEWQIHKLWHGIEALTVHNTMFVVLFLLSIGEILNEVKSQLSVSDFVRWRRRVFSPKQERYLQQAQQLANMGKFARKYASMGKKRLLILDKLRKDEDKDSYEALFAEHPMPAEVVDSVLDDEQVSQNPFPDSTEDLEGDLLKEHVDAVITFKRLKAARINFVTFDQAYLLAAFKKKPIQIKTAKKIADWLQEKGTVRTQKKWFDILILNKMVFPDRQPRQSPPQDSLDYLLGNFVNYCKEIDFRDVDWLEKQKHLVEGDLIRQSNLYLKKFARAFGISLSTRRSN